MADDSKDAKDVLLTLHRENSEQARYYGQQRQTIANATTVATSIVLGALLLGGESAPGSGRLFVCGFFLLVLGGFGFGASLRHHERSRLHVQRVHAIRREISTRFPVDIPALYRLANQEHVKRFARMSDRTARMHYLWQGLHAAVSMIGLTVLCMAC